MFPAGQSILETYKVNVLRSQWVTTIMYDFFTRVHITIFFYLSSYYNFFILLFGWCSHVLYSSVYLVYSIGNCSPTNVLILYSLSIILTSYHKGRWFSFSLHLTSTIPDFLISPCTTTFRGSSSLIFSGLHVYLCTLQQLQGMGYTWFLFMLNPLGGLIRKSDLRRVEPLVNIILTSYGLHIFLILSPKHLT